MPSLLRFVACSCTEHTLSCTHGNVPHWLSIRRVGVRADAQERSPVPLSDASEDLTDFALDEDSPADECSQNSSAHGQDDGDSDSDEHGGSDSAGKTALNGATSLVSMFGTGWLSSTVFNVLYKRVANRPVYLDKASLTAVNNFKRALCKSRGKDAYEWNQQLSANLEQLAEERQHDAEHREMLTDNAALLCCWRWMHNFRFTPEQRELPNRQQRSIFNTIMHRELGCLRRAQGWSSSARLAWLLPRKTSSHKAKRQCLLASSHTSAASRKKCMKRGSEVGTSRADRELFEALLKSARTHRSFAPTGPSSLQKEHRSFAPTGPSSLQKERAKVLKTSMAHTGHVRGAPWTSTNDADFAKRKNERWENDDTHPAGRSKKTCRRDGFIQQ